MIYISCIINSISHLRTQLPHKSSQLHHCGVTGLGEKLGENWVAGLVKGGNLLGGVKE